MTTQPITIELPETVVRQLMRMADALQQPLEALVSQSVLSNLPPSAENAPPELQPVLLEMQRLSDAELKELAQSHVASAQHQWHTELLARNAEGQLAVDEQRELAELRKAADQMMLRKGYALSILRWRGHRLPALEDLPLPQ